MTTLSIIIPVYNERHTLEKILKKVEQVDLKFKKEIIIIDDGSDDGTREILKKLDDNKCRIFYQEKNRGKGAAIKAGFQKGTGDIFIIQDADLEYDPAEYPRLIKPILEGQADVVYGSRFVGSQPKRVLFFWHWLGNRFLTLFSNLFTNLNLTDMETCYKVFRRAVVDSIKTKLRSERFGIEPELTARVAKGGWRIYEIGISYQGRTYTEGKKIKWKDGLAAIWHILYFNLIARNK